MSKILDVIFLRGLSRPTSPMPDDSVPDPVGLVSKVAKASTASKLAGLSAVVGVTAAAILLTHTPMEESGRTVDVTIDENTGEAVVRHVKGKQYLRVYLDIAGIPTACDGITGKDLRGRTEFTEAECTALLEKQLIIHAEGIKRCAPNIFASGGPYVIAASVSMAYNIGVGGFCGSTAKRHLEAGRIVAGCNNFLSWNKARVNGQLRPVRGLTYRRNRERQVCLTGTPGYSPETMWLRVARYH